MRDYLVIVIVLASLPLALLRPYLGLLVYSWIAYMSPHRMAWGFAYNFPVALTVSVATLAGLVFTRERRPPPAERETFLLAALWVIITIATCFAINTERAWHDWTVTSKVLLMTFVMLALVQERQRLHYLLLTIALCIGFFGLKGGIFALVHRGEYMVLGSPESFIEDNNGLALALNMVLPILFYLARVVKHSALKLLLRAMFVFSIAGILFTYSRGGFVALVIVLALIFYKSTHRFLIVAALIVALSAAAPFVPKRFVDRISTLAEYKTDPSAVGRLDAWAFSWRVAVDRPLIGGGFKVASPQTYAKYQPTALRPVTAHSIYFQILGEQGFIALFLFLWLLVGSWGSCRWIRRVSRTTPGAEWLSPYADMLQTSLAAYMIGGVFLSRAYFDLAYSVLAAIIVLKALARRERRPASEIEPEEAPGGLVAPSPAQAGASRC